MRIAPKLHSTNQWAVYQLSVLPFGLTNAPATFQAVMNNIFNPPEYDADGTKNPDHVLTKCILVFIGDILVFGRNCQ